MNDGSFTQLVAVKAGLTNEEAASFIEGFATVIKETVKKDGKIELEGFGKFEMIDERIHFFADKDLTD